jgi:oligopeptide/dipeptide ABC transporter ATP-binding protein
MPKSMPTHQEGSLLEVANLTVDFHAGRGRPPFRAVNDVTFSVERGETLGLVGESGSGKTTIGRAILGLTSPSAGRIRFDGQDITRLSGKARRGLSARLQVIFQDPYSSLNPTRTIGQTLSETARVHVPESGQELRQRVDSILERVGLDPSAADKYPSQFSGGQRQRIAIARALVLRPELVICDEPVSALDLSIQAQVLNLLKELQREMGLGYLFVAHDLAVVRFLSHRIMVLYRGSIMEQGDAETVYTAPHHPYTRSLLDAAPVPDPAEQLRRRRARLKPATAHAAPAASADACPFANRCPHTIDVCRERRPALEITDRGSVVACHRWRELDPDGQGREVAAAGHAR